MKRRALLIAALIASNPLRAQVAAPNAETAALKVAATLIPTASAPKIDGDISDAIWQNASLISDFYQREPQPMAAPSERTEVRLLYTREQLYIAVHAYDSEPDRIVSTTKQRDAMLFADDYFRVTLDPKLTRRDGYSFEVNAAGAQGDGLTQNGGFEANWNMIWSAASRRVNDGWTAEFAIPFRGLSYDPGRSEWGLHLTRKIARKGETVGWGKSPPGVRFNELSYEGTVTDLGGMTQGKGLDVQLYGAARYTRDWPSYRDTAVGRPSGTVYYKFNSGLTGLLTFNTDFSDAPLDSRQVNTTRFQLFEPETREFFLEDTANFDFGSSGVMVGGGGGGNTTNGRAFFSRNIGLVNGRAVDIVAGGKLSGTAGPLTIGALSVRTQRDAVTPGQTLSVVRLTTNVLDDSKIGAIVTNGDPTGLTRNSVAGADFQYRNSNFRPGKQLLANAYVERSFSDLNRDDNAYGLGLNYPNEPWSLNLRMQEIGADFLPKLGFVNRSAIRTYNGDGGRIWRRKDAFIRRFEIRGYLDLVTGLDNRLQSRTSRLETRWESINSDMIQFGVNQGVEVLPASFAFPGGISVPAGRYQWHRALARLDTSFARPLSLTLQVECCDYYNGTSRNVNLELRFRPNATFGAELREQVQKITLPSGYTTIRIESLQTNIYFTPQLHLKSELQYDNVSQRLGASIRLRWQVRPVTELFVALGETSILTGSITGGEYHSQGSAVVVRVGHRLQY